jgi:dTDP-4-dehydrorhamnose reductase
MNHYVTSERFLHSRVRAFPACFAASNGRDRYADLEAVRMELPPKRLGPEARLSELWKRYKLPIAITEVHLGGTRDEQLRWLLEVWEAAVRLRRAAVDIRSVTSWSLFGAVDWNSLLTRASGFYESGAFDVRGDRPRMTAVGEAVRRLAKQGTFSHPVAANAPGWWHRPERLYTRNDKAHSRRRPKHRPLLVLAGDNRHWIQAFIRSARTRGLEYAVVPCSRLKAGAEEPLLASVRRLRAWALIDVRGFAAGPFEGKDRSSLYRSCQEIGVRVAQVSDNLELESAETSGEQLVAIRSTVSGAKDAPLSPAMALIFLGRPHAVDTLIDLLIDGEQGVWTCSSKGFKTGPTETTMHSAKS